jgi:hypothetical protein
VTSSEDSALAPGTGDPESDVTYNDKEGSAVDDRDSIDAWIWTSTKTETRAKVEADTGTPSTAHSLPRRRSC